MVPWSPCQLCIFNPMNLVLWVSRDKAIPKALEVAIPVEIFSLNSQVPPKDLVRGLKGNKFSTAETKEISAFFNRAFVRLEAWFQWFNTTQSGKDPYTYYWHGRDDMTTRELNPKTLASGLDDYPRASHPSDQERHVDLRCWMLLAADCMNSIAEFLEMKDGKVYDKLLKQLSDFEILNQLHLDDVSGAYFDFGNHTEKVRLRWYQVKEGDSLTRELLREVLEDPQLQLVPHIGYVSLFPFMMGIIPPASHILEKQLELISNRTILWTDYGLRSLAKTSSLHMKHNTEHDPPYWRGQIWINMNYMILSALHHYAQEDGPYSFRARNIVKNYYENGYLWEQYEPKNKGKGKGARPFTGWTALVLLIMAEAYPDLVGSGSAGSLADALSSSASGVGGRVIDALLHPHHRTTPPNKEQAESNLETDNTDTEAIAATDGDGDGDADRDRRETYYSHGVRRFPRFALMLISGFRGAGCPFRRNPTISDRCPQPRARAVRR
ncbi:hypothetical protein Taro_043395 [Colocasia esculenta]|uniref:Glycosyl hydrolase family 63 C-terminal domain-containing protein n=1 Tax=Colocasia esculenta TaxID=4460 RepID=A0A843WYU3_COLES|nr:hypothetical protein [Colocasia esculenta]